MYLKAGSSGSEDSGRKISWLWGGGNSSDERAVEPDIPVSSAVVQALAERLQDEESGIREDAAVSLATVRGRTALPAMIRRLGQESDKDALLAVIRALGKIGDVGSGRELVHLVYHEDTDVRNQAIATLGRLRCPDAVSDLTKLYESDAEQRKKLFRIIPLVD